MYLATGIKDRFVPPDHSLRAFNDLADESDQFTEAEISEIVEKQKIPDWLAIIMTACMRQPKKSCCLKKYLMA
ncbi:hypothetical protein [Legionella israelensis]|uniref:hypothetical protein n=1 Tax=Legionella israelensis TaxID=454 RepID=UPI00072FAB2B|nr:hypothetical protein [Legionella israelensis]QBS09127.1 hypothetical protein E4T55_04230 [Legionella israelensis]